MTPSTATTTVPLIDYSDIRRAIAKHLRLAPDTIEPDTPLTAYGIDSLGALELVAMLEDRFGCTLPESLLTDNPTLATLAAHLSAGPAPAMARSRDLTRRLQSDSCLSSDILPGGRVTHPDAPRCVLLTGATGFLGSALLRALVDRGHAVICVVRPTTIDAHGRVDEALRRYGLWRDGDGAKVEVVAGDLERPLLGLPPETYSRLTESVTDVCHAAADISWVSAYDSLQRTNVEATTSLLRFACTGTTKRFQFVSSLSVCFAVNGPPAIEADADMQAYAGALPLGYAQSKCVGESLVREAARRGLPAQVVRPALLTGHSNSGLTNLDDLISALVKGCIQLGAAPDLDWVLDAVPVDTAASAIARALDDMAVDAARTFVLRHSRPRHWRECVLWMNLFGYRIVLEPYDIWVARLLRDGDPQGPLHRLRGFFTRRIDGLSVPEHYQEHVRTRLLRPARDEVDYPPLDAHRLDIYFRSFIERGFLEAPVGLEPAVPGASGTPNLRAVVESAVGQHSGERLVVSGIETERLTGHSIIGELTSWRRRQQTGLFRCRVATAAGSPALPCEVVVKLKPPDEDVLTVAEAMAAMCDADVEREMRMVRGRLGIIGSRDREVALYRTQRQTGLERYMPRCYGAWLPGEADRAPGNEPTIAMASGVAGLVLERLDAVTAMNAVDAPDQWTDEHLTAAVDGIADVHGLCTSQIRAIEGSDWIGYVPTTVGAIAMASLWRSLARVTAQQFSTWAGHDLPRRHRQLIDSLEDWWPVLERGPRTLVHHDFNPRNIAVRKTIDGPRLVAYDWELATIHAPQRDLAELLCFVLPPDVNLATLDGWIERHRDGYQRSSGTLVASRDWRIGFRSALYDVLISRLAFYALIGRVTRQSFLPRVMRTWTRIDQLIG